MSDPLSWAFGKAKDAFTGTSSEEQIEETMQYADSDNDAIYGHEAGMVAMDESYAFEDAKQADTMPVPQACGSIPALIFNPHKDFEALTSLFGVYKGTRKVHKMSCGECDHEWEIPISADVDFDDEMCCPSCGEEDEGWVFHDNETVVVETSRKPSRSEVLFALGRTDDNLTMSSSMFRQHEQRLRDYFSYLSGAPLPRQYAERNMYMVPMIGYNSFQSWNGTHTFNDIRMLPDEVGKMEDINNMSAPNSDDNDDRYEEDWD